ncbi:phage scaffolding protein [Virgibacillus sp. W0430]|uniref:phage scaffolding protein n=1 Tax=Virgibacillus sp. W0430 TaxID=3391580 RepID=UPI003F459914
MNREFLREQGLSDEQIEAVMREHGKSINSVKEKADKVDDLESQIEDLQTQIKDRDTQLNDLSEKVKDNEELTNTIEQLKKDNKTATEELQQKLEKQAFDFALEKAIANAQAKNPKAVKALLDTESIKLDGETLLGLEDQLTALKESDAYLFGEDKPRGLEGRQPHVGGGEPKGLTRDDINKMSYKERVQFKQENPEEYEKIIKGE